VTTPPRPFIVVPCYNEARRIDETAFVDLARDGRLRLLFVDDGSTDGTGAVLARMAKASKWIEVFTLAANAGKAEAVRRGLLVAVRNGAEIVGYYDADQATPPAELVRLTRRLQREPELAAVLGSRVARMGSSVRRKAVRHYLGRVYGTLAVMALGVTVYDTQCGAKVFRVNEALVNAISTPFRSSWSFDVELLHRLLSGSGQAPGLPESSFEEMPLETWHDVSGSKLKLSSALLALFDLLTIARKRWRRGRPGLREAEERAPAEVIAPQLRAGDRLASRRFGHHERRRQEA